MKINNQHRSSIRFSLIKHQFFIIIAHSDNLISRIYRKKVFCRRLLFFCSLSKMFVFMLNMNIPKSHFSTSLISFSTCCNIKQISFFFRSPVVLQSSDTWAATYIDINIFVCNWRSHQVSFSGDNLEKREKKVINNFPHVCCCLFMYVWLVEWQTTEQIWCCLWIHFRLVTVY